ncbi:Tumor necrosis factor receptor superfamily member 18, partial [Frankliniella fusca]
MSNPSRDVWLVSWMLLACLIGNLTSLQPAIGCNATMEGCLKCRSTDLGGSLCVKCTNLIVMESRLCVDSCPLGYREEWSSQIDYMGRVCAEGSLLLGALALSGSRLSVVVGVLCGAAICILLLVTAGILLHFRRSRSTRHWKQEEQHLSAGSAQSTISRHSHGDAAERGEFLKHIWTLRSEAPVFLAMLNDTRRQVRTLLQAHTSKHSAVQAYRPVLKDLSRILILLNRRDDCITYPPDDWRTLLGWGERVLRRYKKHNPQE